MSESFPVSGNIEPESFPHLLVDLHHQGATGSLKITGPNHPKALYFRNGRVLFGSSNDPRDQLGSILIEAGKITREQLDEVNTKVGPGNPLAKVLAESGFVNQRELGDAARVKVERILADVLSWDSGSFEFEDGVLPKGAVDLKLSTERLLLAAVQRIPERAFALRHVDLRTVLEPTPDGDAALSEIRGEVWPLLERLDGRRSLKDAIALTRLDEFEAAKTACALLFLGVVHKKDVREGEELDLAQEAQSGLAGQDEGAPLFSIPSATTAGPALASSEPEPDQPFFFPAPAPPPAPEASPAIEVESEQEEPEREEATAPQPEPELEPTIVMPEAAPPIAPVVAPEAPLVAAPSIPFPPAAEAPGQEPTEVTPTPLPSFAPEPPLPRRVSFDTLPGDRPAYAPPPLIPPPSRKPAPAPNLGSGGSGVLEISVTAPATSRPTRADLAALDELLNPAASGRARPAGGGRPDKWQPQFRPSTAAPRRVALRAAPSGRSRVPLVLAAVLAAVAVASVAAWYFLLRTPAARVAAPPVTLAGRPAPSPRPAPTPTAPTPATASSSIPPAATSPAPAATRAPVPATMPGAVAAASAATPAPRAAPPASDPRALLRRGALPEAARAFAASLRPGARSRFSLQMLTACAADTVQKASTASGSDDLFILPVALNGRSCYRVCWGVYDDRQGAEAGLATVPAYFRQGGAKPRVSPLAELLP